MRLRRAVLQIPARSFLPPGLPFYKIHLLSTHSKSTLLQLLIPQHFNSPRINTYKKPGRGVSSEPQSFTTRHYLCAAESVTQHLPQVQSPLSFTSHFSVCSVEVGTRTAGMHFPSDEACHLSPLPAPSPQVRNLSQAPRADHPSVPRIPRCPAPRPPEPARRKVGVYSQPAGGQNESPPSVFHKKLPRRIGATQPSPLTFAGWSTQHAGLQTSGTAAFDYHPAG